MTNPFADILKMRINRTSSRLPFEQMCAFYAALSDGVPPTVVACASGLDISTIGSLRAAGTRFAGQMRYPKIAAEYARLGRLEFIHKYVSAEITDRLRVAADQVRRKKLEPPNKGGPNRHADKFAGAQPLKDPMGGPDQFVSIEFDQGEQPGWTWRDRNPHAEIDAPRGDPRDQERRFANSAAAFDFCKLRFVPTEAQIRSGEHELACNDAWFWEQQKLK